MHHGLPLYELLSCKSWRIKRIQALEQPSYRGLVQICQLYDVYSRGPAEEINDSLKQSKTDHAAAREERSSGGDDFQESERLEETVKKRKDYAREEEAKAGGNAEDDGE